MSPPVNGAACALHGKTHVSPRNFTIELHHIIPVGWQLTWQPPQPWPNPGKDRDGRGDLWDARTISAAPSCHRNVHFWIVAMMVAVKNGATQADAIRGVGARPVTKRVKASSLPEWVLAVQALDRFTTVGGDLAELIAAGEMGSA